MRAVKIQGGIKWHLAEAPSSRLTLCGEKVAKRTLLDRAVKDRWCLSCNELFRKKLLGKA